MDVLSRCTVTSDGNELRYWKSFKPSDRYTDGSLENVVIQLALYRLCREYRIPIVFSTPEITELMFDEEGPPSWLSPRRVGLTIRRVCRFDPRKQVIGKSGKYTWGHCIMDPLNLQYGLEYLMAQWIPWTMKNISMNFTREWFDRQFDNFAQMDVPRIKDVRVKLNERIKKDPTFHPWTEADRFTVFAP